MDKNFVKLVAEVQHNLKAPKNQKNSFGNYNYRSCEDIMEAVKPLLSPRGLIIFISDEVSLVGDRYYIKATATITDGENSLSNTAFARESLDKKGMDSSQVTGATSSYARKYALNGLLCIDDNKDADTNEHHNEVVKRGATHGESVKVETKTETQKTKAEVEKEIPADLFKKYDQVKTKLNGLVAIDDKQKEWATDFIKTIRVYDSTKADDLKKILDQF